jgi:hypothetical protein
MAAILSGDATGDAATAKSVGEWRFPVSVEP